MNLFELFVKIGVDDQASGNLKELSSKLGSGLKTAAKIGTAAVGAAAAGITALTTAAVNNYAEYEQLVGGVDTLFKDASQKVQKYAADAYKTAGMSANDYMANATAFSASLISSLGGDTEKAAEYANRAMVSMSDNANKMGTSLDSIVQTYQSLSRGNMAMLDNLKLGYGGTKAELERLIKDAASYTDIQKEMGVTVDASSMSFDNIVNAIAVVQGKLGIAGATAAEASTTIEGSVNSMKAAWSNLVTGIADENAQFGTLVNNFVESAATALDNILPRIEESLYGVDALIYRMFPIIMERIPKIISDFLPRLVETATMIVQSIVDGISQNQEMLMTTAMETITYLANSLIKMLPQIVKLGLDLIVSLADGIAENTDELLPTIFDVVGEIIGMIIENAPRLAEAAFGIIDALGNSLAEEIPGLSWVFENLETAVIAVAAAMVAYKTAMSITSLIENVKNAITAFKAATEGQTLAQTLLNAVMNANPFVLVATLIAGLVAAVITLWNTNEGFRNALIGAWDAIKNAAVVVWESIVKFFTEDIPNAFNAVINFVKDNWQALLLFITNPIAGALKLLYDLNPKFREWVDNVWQSIKNGFNKIINGAKTWGKDLLDNFIGGIKAKIQNLKDMVSNVAQTVKDFLGFSEPEKGPLSNFHTYAPDMMDLFAKGIRDNEDVITDQIEKSFDFGERTMKFGAEYGDGYGVSKVAGGAFGGTSIGNINIKIDGAKYSDEQSLASAIALEIQNMTDRRAAVYA